MKIDIRPRAAGKTYNLICQAHQQNKDIIVATPEDVKRMIRYADELGLGLSRSPIAASKLRDSNKNTITKSVFIDELDSVVEALVGRTVEIATIDTSHILRSETTAKQRVQAELEDLRKRTTAIELFVVNRRSGFWDLSDNAQKLLQRQYFIMSAYISVLQLRLDKWEEI